MKLQILLTVLWSSIWVIDAVVYNITQENYQQVTGNKTMVVLFFTSEDVTCIDCATVFPKFVRVSQLFEGRNVAFIKSSDKDHMMTLGLANHALPVVAFSSPSTDVPLVMMQPFSVDNLVTEIVERSQGRVLRPPTLTYTINLTPLNFDAVVKSPHYYVMIFLHDNKTTERAGVFDEVAKVFKNDDEIVLANMDRSKEPELSKQFAMLQLPAIYWFDKSDKTKRRYGGYVDVVELVTFINDESDLRRKLTGDLSDTAGRIKHLDKLLEEHMDDIYLGKNMKNIVEAFETEASRVKNGATYSRYYVELLSAIKSNRNVRITEELFFKISVKLSKENLIGVEKDDAIRRKNILKKFNQEIKAAAQRAKNPRSGETLTVNLMDDDRAMLRDEL